MIRKAKTARICVRDEIIGMMMDGVNVRPIFRLGCVLDF